MLPVPTVTPLSGPYWAAANRGELQIMQCATCGSFRHPPTTLCRRCGAETVRWSQLSGRGVVYSFIVDHRMMIPGFDEPYVVAQITPDEAFGDSVRIVANILDCHPSDVSIGMPVEVCFQRRGNLHLPQFVPRLDDAT